MNAGGIVVGLCGSHASRAALEWAVAEAVLRGSCVQVLSVLTNDSEDCRQVNRMQAHLTRSAGAGLMDPGAIARRWVTDYCMEFCACAVVTVPYYGIQPPDS